jgi:hypothetical protein
MHLATCLHQMRRKDREARVGRERGGMGNLGLAGGTAASRLPSANDVFLDLPDGVGDVADHLDLREVDRIDLGRAWSRHGSPSAHPSA